jgi:hypothetical protein
MASESSELAKVRLLLCSLNYRFIPRDSKRTVSLHPVPVFSCRRKPFLPPLSGRPHYIDFVLLLQLPCNPLHSTFTSLTEHLRSSNLDHTNYRLLLFIKSSKHHQIFSINLITMASQLSESDLSLLVSCFKNSSTKLTPDFDKVAQECGLKGSKAA